MTDSATTMSSRDFNRDTGRAKKAAARGPVYITDRGQPSHVLLSFADYHRLVDATAGLVDHLCATPGIGDIDLELPVRGDLPRAAEFD